MRSSADLRPSMSGLNVRCGLRRARFFDGYAVCYAPSVASSIASRLPLPCRDHGLECFFTGRQTSPGPRRRLTSARRHGNDAIRRAVTGGVRDFGRTVCGAHAALNTTGPLLTETPRSLHALAVADVAPLPTRPSASKRPMPPARSPSMMISDFLIRQSLRYSAEHLRHRRAGG